jgi:hypothetical protein
LSQNSLRGLARGENTRLSKFSLFKIFRAFLLQRFEKRCKGGLFCSAAQRKFLEFANKSVLLKWIEEKVDRWEGRAMRKIKLRHNERERSNALASAKREREENRNVSAEHKEKFDSWP